MIAQPASKIEFRAAGTDLSERRRSGVSRGPIADLKTTEQMTDIRWDERGAAQIGASVTVETIAADPRLRAAYPGLAAAAGGLATPQIRALATLGGNLAQRNRCWYYRNPHFDCLKKGGDACPARTGNHLYHVIFDLGPCVAPHPSTLGAALLAYEGVVTTNLRSDVPVAEIFGDGSNGAADNSLRDGEQILFVGMNVPLAGERASYRRAISRTFAEWPLVEIVVRAVVEKGAFRFVRVAAGGVAPVPLRLQRVEDALQAGPADQAAIRSASARAISSASPLPQTGYKLQLLQRLVADVVHSVVE